MDGAGCKRSPARAGSAGATRWRVEAGLLLSLPHREVAA